MLHSTSKSQGVSSHKRRTDDASEVVFGPRLRRALAHATASLRFASLARSNKQARKQASKQAIRRKGRMAPETAPNRRNDTEKVPLEARGVQRLKKQAITAPKRRRKRGKKEHGHKWSPKRCQKRARIYLRLTFRIIVLKVSV